MQIYDVIIPVYNGYNYLQPLFNSLRDGTKSLHRLIIINDCSSDLRIRNFLDNIKYDNSYCQDIIIHHNKQNQGFVKSVNYAYTLTKNNFVILNTDTEVPNDWLRRLMRPIEQDAKIASVTPLTNAGTICSFPIWLEDNELAFGLQLQEIDDAFKNFNDENLLEVPTGVGFCMAINRQVVERIGFFDDNTFGLGYGEENDWCMRAKKAGYKNVIARNLYVYHKHGGSFGALKQKLIEENALKLLKKHSEYELEVQRIIKQRPLDNFFAKVILDLFLKYKPAIIFCHDWGGGSDHFIHEHLYDDVENNYVVLIRGSGIHIEKNIELIENKTTIMKITIPELQDILLILSQHHLQDYHLNHLIRFNDLSNNIDLIIDFFKTNNINPIYYLHDYFFVCPTINLMNHYRRYCGVPTDWEVCNNCLSKNDEFIYTPISSSTTIQEWRNKFGSLLDLTKKIYAFSDCSKNIFLKVYPQLADKIGMYQLRLAKLNPVLDGINLFHKKRLRVGILGAVSVLKGQDIIQQSAILVKELNLPIEFVLIGYTAKAIDYISITGRYNKKDLPNICLREGIDIFVIPSVWPETYCYAADEIMSMGYPLVCFDIGAPAERVKNYKYGFIADEINPIKLLEKIIHVASNLGFDSFCRDKVDSINNQTSAEIMLKFYNELKLIRNELNQVYHSSSWKVTKPLRKIMKLFRR